MKTTFNIFYVLKLFGGQESKRMILIGCLINHFLVLCVKKWMVNYLFINKFKFISFFSFKYSQLFPLNLFSCISISSRNSFASEGKTNLSLSDTISAFIMKDLRRLYHKVRRNLDASEEIINNVNVTRLK